VGNDKPSESPKSSHGAVPISSKNATPDSSPMSTTQPLSQTQRPMGVRCVMRRQSLVSVLKPSASRAAWPPTGVDLIRLPSEGSSESSSTKTSTAALSETDGEANDAARSESSNLELLAKLSASSTSVDLPGIEKCKEENTSYFSTPFLASASKRCHGEDNCHGDTVAPEAKSPRREVIHEAAGRPLIAGFHQGETNQTTAFGWGLSARMVDGKDCDVP